MLHRKEIPFYISKPSEWKSGIGIKERTRAKQKKETQNFVLKLIGERLPEDECDAIGMAWHYLSL